MTTLGAPRPGRRIWAALWLGWGGWFFLFLATAWSAAELRSPPPTPLLEDRTGRYLAEANKDSSDLGFWDAPQPLNPKIVEAVIAAEDARFRWFPGVDPLALVRAFLSDLTGGRTQGGSTLAMQVARLQSLHDRTWTNKILEMATGFFLIVRHGHDAVLAHYLKLIPQGNRIFGVAYGARRYFHKPLDDVSLAEAYVLASLAQAPGKMNLFTGEGFDAARARAKRIFGLVRARGNIEEADYQTGLLELERMPLPRPEARPNDTYHFVLRALAEDQKRGNTSYARPRMTTLDPRVQEVTQEVVRRLYEDHAAYNVGNAAALVADRRTGEVMGYVGSYSYFATLGSGGIDYIQVPRSSGSTLKPLLYAAALQEGVSTPATVLADLPFSILDPQGVYRPGNFDDDFLGPMLFRRALGNSRNIPVLRILERVGLERSYQYLTDLGLVHEARGASYYGYGLALGGLYVSLQDLVRAYGILGTGGQDFQLSFFRDQPRVEPRQIISAFAAQTISLGLADDTARQPSFPRGSALDYPWPVAVKTGTSQGYRDAWAIAFDDKYVAGVWLGDGDNRRMNRVAGLVAAGGLRDLLTTLEPLQAQGIDTVPFRPPEGTFPVTVCALSGEVAGDDCQNTSVEWFLPRNAPRQICSVHLRYPIDRRTGAMTTANTPPSEVAFRPFTVLGPEYTLWSAQRGLGLPPVPREGPRSLRLMAPLDKARYYRDPETPAAYQTLPLQVQVSPSPAAIDWYVDGHFYQSVPSPFQTRWALVPGIHRFQARWPGSQEGTKEVTVEIR